MKRFLWLLVLSGLWGGVARAATVGPLHSHNDYSSSSPLELALKSGFQSVEADIWKWGDELQVGHVPFIFKGTLRELYLEPLLFRIRGRHGSVHGDGKTFFLWIEFKDSQSESVDLLRDELARLPIFTEFTDGGIRWGAVTVILTGNEKNKERFVSLPGSRFATRDSEWISSSDPVSSPSVGNQWLWYALDWKRFFSWNGKGSISQRELAELRSLLGQAHGLGRKVRFFNVPDLVGFWRLARAEAFDLVGTDRIEALSHYWRGPAVRTAHSPAFGSNGP